MHDNDGILQTFFLILSSVLVSNLILNYNGLILETW